MRVGVIGLGDIAEKAYLPTLAARPDLDLALMTRDPVKLARIGDSWRIARRLTDLDALIDGGLDAAFVHAATEAHPAIATRLLEAGIPVYVDKPLAYRLAEAEAIVNLAEQRGGSLMVGFNRRFAPGYAGLAVRPRDLVLMQKHRAALPEDPRRAVFDDFIHVVDTLRFLAPGPVARTTIETKVREGLLRQVTLTLSGDGFTAIGLMNRESGAAEEVLEIAGGGGKRRVVNLAEVVDLAGAETVARRGDWTPVSVQRGIAQACDHFLDAVHEGRRLDARDALETHRLCEQIVAAAG